MESEQRHNDVTRPAPSEAPAGQADTPADTPAQAPAETPADEAVPAELLVERLREDLAQAEASYKRALADLQNFRRRSVANECEAREQGIRSVVQRVVTVLDHFDLALAQDPAQITIGQLLDGVRVIRDELLAALLAVGVERIEPRPDEPFDPLRHEAVMRRPTDQAAPGHIVETLQAGYAIGDRTIRPAKVAVAADVSESCDDSGGPGATPAGD